MLAGSGDDLARSLTRERYRRTGTDRHRQDRSLPDRDFFAHASHAAHIARAVSTDAIDVKATRIVITEIIENTYYALIHVNDGNREVTIDSRPSDAVAIALRVQVPIFVEEDVLEVRKADELEEWLKNLKPEDFGNIM
jgi:bifunctional DNase/RNase